MIVGLKDYERALQLAKEAILNDELIVYPTDTLYGLGANALSERAVQKVFEAKKRESKPISIIVANLEMLKRYCHVSDKQEKFLIELLPGPYTVILKKRYDFPVNLTRSEGIGVRVPEHFFALTLVKQLDLPITATSANLSGGRAPVKVEEVEEGIVKRAKLVVDGGECKLGMGSTIIDFVGNEVKIVREGAGLEKAKELFKLFKL